MKKLQRRRRSQPPAAPWLVPVFWGAAVVVAVILGPLLLARADWLWRVNEPAAPPPEQPASSFETLETRARLDLLADRPLVAHVVVALADNEAQGIVPVPPALGDGDDPDGNLYWGARYGVATWFARDAAEARGWERVALAETAVGAGTGEEALPEGVLRRVVFRRDVERDGVKAEAYVVADAWRGAAIREATLAFLRYAAGAETIAVRAAAAGNDAGQDARNPVEIRAGGRAHVVAFVGHDGLMDFTIPADEAPERDADAPPRAAIVLACASEPYFRPLLERAGAWPMVTTTDLMAPEAYSLQAALDAWFDGPEGAGAMRAAAAEAYDRFQGCGSRAASRLFAVGS